MKQSLLILSLVFLIGCQKSGTSEKLKPNSDLNCQKYAAELTSQFTISQEDLFKYYVKNLNGLDADILAECLDQLVELKCQNNTCEIRKKL